METKVDSGTVFDVDFGRRGDKGNFLAFEYPNSHPTVMKILIIFNKLFSKFR